MKSAYISSLPLSNPEIEAEAQEYAKSYGCDIASARRDVMDEYANAQAQEAAEYRITGGDVFPQ
jgi:hypothetical protein